MHRLVALALLPFALWSQEEQPERHASPDGRRVAYAATRPSDQWLTIWLSDRGQTRDLLPGDVDGRLGSPGIRAVKIGTWLNNREIAFLYHCGTGCVGIHKVDADSAKVSEIWTGTVDGGVHWSPARDRAAVEAHLGELLLVGVDGSVKTLAGCTIESGQWRGQWHGFDGWTRKGDSVRVKRRPCESYDESSPAAEAELLVWDGRRLAR